MDGMKVRARMLLMAVVMFSATASGQELAVKTNLLTDAIAVPSVGVEYAFAPRWTVNADAEWMPFYRAHNHYLRTLKVQPEARFWFRTPFAGPFVGPSVGWRVFNMGGLPVFDLKNERIQGNLWTAGATAGWHFTLSDRLGLEPAVSLGYGYADYKRYAEPRSRRPVEHSYQHYIGPIALSLYLVYMLY